MHRFVVDQLFQERGRGVPVDPPELQEARIEPAREQVLQVLLQARERRIVASEAHQVVAQVHQELHAIGQRIELTQQAFARRIQGIPERLFRSRPAVRRHRFQHRHRLSDHRRVPVELGRQNGEVAAAAGLR